MPWIDDKSGFVDLMDKYKGKVTFTDEERAEIIVKLGIYELAPQWLTQKSKKIVKKYYPNISEKHSYINFGSREKFAWVRVAVDHKGICAVASMSLLVAPGAFSITEYEAVIAEAFVVNPALGLDVGGLLTAAAVSAINAAKQPNTPDILKNNSVPTSDNATTQNAKPKTDVNDDEEQIVIVKPSGRNPHSNCNEIDETFLNNHMNYICSTAYACTQMDIGKPDIIETKIAAIKSCIRARQDIIDQCYGGVPNIGHGKSVSEREKSIANCEKFLRMKKRTK